MTRLLTALILLIVATGTALAQAPTAPSAIRLNSTASALVTISWADNSSTETSFRVERKTGAGGTYAEVGSTSTDDRDFDDTTTSASTAYFYRVRARNGSGDSAYAAEVALTTPATGRTLTTVRAYPMAPNIDVGRDKVFLCLAQDAAGARFRNINPTWTVTDGTKLTERPNDEDSTISGYETNTSYGMSSNFTVYRGAATGTTTVKCSVSGVDSALRTVTVRSRTTTPNASMTGDLTPGGTINLKVGEPFHLNATASTGMAVASVNWGDGMWPSSKVERFVHAYDRPGTFTVTLTVTNESGTTHAVSGTAIVTAFGAPAATCSASSYAQIATCYSTLDTAQGGQINITSAITGNQGVVLGSRTNSGWIEIIKSGATLPDIRQRIAPDNPNLATLSTSDGNAIPIKLGAGAHHIRLRGLKLDSTNAPFGTFNLLLISGSTHPTPHNLADDPHHIIVEHMVMDVPHATIEVRRGIGLEGRLVSVMSSYLRGFRSTQDTQAIGGINGTGQHYIYNNYLESTGECMMYGGGAGLTDGHTPFAVEIRWSHFERRLEWRALYGFTKNLFETKGLQDLFMEGCILNNEWSAAQNIAIVLKTASQDDTFPWAETARLHLENIKLLHVSGAINTIWDFPIPGPCIKPSDITFTNILMDDISAANWGASGDWAFFVRTNYVTVNHVTATTSDGRGILLNGEQTNLYDITVQNSVLVWENFGILRSGGLQGTNALNAESGGRWTFNKNLVGLLTESAANYPNSGGNINSYQTSVANMKFTNYAGGDFSLAADSPGKNAATDGTDMGYNKTLVDAQTLHTVDGDWTGMAQAANGGSSGRGQGRLRGKGKIK
jgi:hypothetical protein